MTEAIFLTCCSQQLNQKHKNTGVKVEHVHGNYVKIVKQYGEMDSA